MPGPVENIKPSQKEQEFSFFQWKKKKIKKIEEIQTDSVRLGGGRGAGVGWWGVAERTWQLAKLWGKEKKIQTLLGKQSEIVS